MRERLHIQRALAGPRIARLAGDAPAANRWSADDDRAFEETLANPSPGRPLDGDAGRFLGGQLGHSLADVRIHADGEADQMARTVDAAAFTTGPDIFFRDGVYDPGSRAGMHLLAHEAAHVVQQRAGSVAGTPIGDGLAVSDPADPFERAADATAHRIVPMRTEGDDNAADEASVAPIPASPAGGANAGPVPLQRFGSPEHQDIGNQASGNATLDIDLGGGDKLTYGQMVALAGDYFGSLDEIRSLATTPEGQARLKWTRWWALHTGDEPALDSAVKKQVKDRYYTLATQNISHFSAGGTAKSHYEEMHKQALDAAFASGANSDQAKWSDAMATEAFSNHYLTDMFSAGHVRTPRAEIKDWYEKNYPDSVGKFVTYVAHWITGNLDTRGDIPFFIPNSWIEGGIRAQVLELGGSAVESMSIGDIVSLSVHDRDNEGLYVVSDADASGNPVGGGYRWRAIGDNHLGDATKEAADTKAMAVAAVRASLGELTTVKDAGVQAAQGQCLPEAELAKAMDTAVAALQPYGAEKFIPREDITNMPEVTKGNDPNGGSGTIDWRWGQMDDIAKAAVDQNAKTTVAGTLRGKQGEVAPPDGIKRALYVGMPVIGPDQESAVAPLLTLHVRDAFIAFCDYLQAQGIAAIETALTTPAQPPAPIPDAPDGGADATVPK